ncbi:hypothetical protein K474DRAFT_1666134 [Panus rudis PR-1116 ss-1]|nr:hypothetical protein K474DRAFT_1666134 [Panus rudis PR-1116 ss-1]
MGEVVNVLVAFAVIIFVVRWATSGKDDSSSGPSPSAVLGFRPRNVTSDMVETIHNMFPTIPADNIRYDLLRTGSVEVTTNKILERGFLPPPPEAYYTIYPRAISSTTQAEQRPQPATNASASSSKSQPKQSLIERYHLEDRLNSDAAVSSAITPEEVAARGATWEDSPEKRQALLRERKAQMILAARQRLLAQQKNEASTSGSASTSS